MLGRDNRTTITSLFCETHCLVFFCLSAGEMVGVRAQGTKKSIPLSKNFGPPSPQKGILSFSFAGKVSYPFTPMKRPSPLVPLQRFHKQTAITEHRGNDAEQTVQQK